MYCKNSNGEWYIINSKAKVKINDVVISESKNVRELESLWLSEKTI